MSPNAWPRELIAAMLALASGCTLSPDIGISPGDDCTANDNGDADVCNPEVLVWSQFDAAYRTGSSTGQQEVPACDGWFPAAPNNTLTIEQRSGLGIFVDAPGEARLLIQCGDAQFCGELLEDGDWTYAEPSLLGPASSMWERRRRAQR